MTEINAGIEPGAFSVSDEVLLGMLQGVDPDSLLEQLEAMSAEELAALADMVGRDKFEQLLEELLEEKSPTLSDVRSEFLANYHASVHRTVNAETSLALTFQVARQTTNAVICVIEAALGRSLREKDLRLSVANRILRGITPLLVVYPATVSLREIRLRAEAGERFTATRGRKLQREDALMATLVVLTGYEVGGNTFTLRKAKRRSLTGLGRANAVWRVAGDSVVLGERLRSHLAVSK